TVLGVHSVVLSLRRTRLIPCLLKLQLPLSTLRCDFFFDPVQYSRCYFELYWRERLQKCRDHAGIHMPRRHALADVLIAVFITTLTDVRWGAFFCRCPILNRHLAATDTTIDDPL